MAQNSPVTTQRHVGVAASYLALSVAASLIISSLLGMSLWWDTYNYEYYSGWALLHGFGSRFAFPGQLQNYLDPQLNALYYLLLAHLGPLGESLVVSALEALGPALLGFIVYRGALRWNQSFRSSVGLGLVAGALGLCTPLYRSELGSTASDTLITVGLLGGGMLLAVTLFSRTTTGRLRGALFGGALLGATVVAKATAGPLAVGILGGFLLALLLARDLTTPVKERLASWLLAASTSVFVALAVYAPLGVMVWKRYQNPFFPYFNTFAHSSLQKTKNFRDNRFAVHSVHDWCNHFFGLLFGSRLLESGGLLWRSPILALGFLALSGLFLHDLIRRRHALALFIEASGVLGYLIWSPTLSIYRYAAPLEIVMAGLLLLLALERCGPRKAIPWLVAVACALAIAFGGAGAPVKRSAFTSDLFQLNVTTLRAANTGHIVFAAVPSGYVATYLPVSTDIVRIGGNLGAVMSDRWWSLASDHIRTTPGPWRILINEGEEIATETDLGKHGLVATISDCLPLGGGTLHPMAICTLHLP